MPFQMYKPREEEKNKHILNDSQHQTPEDKTKSSLQEL
jgi:hypothetical protein